MNKSTPEIDRILTALEIEAVWGRAVATTPRTNFESRDVPKEVEELIPYAIFWGISDDLMRERVLKDTPQILRVNLKWAIAKFDDQLDNWLAGPEAQNASPTGAYIAFSAMRMGADFI
jgi:hypothetical protein